MSLKPLILSAVLCFTIHIKPLDAQELLVANGFGAPVAYRVATRGGKIVASINMGVNPFDVVVAPDGKTAYASRPDVNDVAVINLAVNTVSAGIALGATPRKMAMNADATRLYVATSDGVTAVDISLQPDGSRSNSVIPEESIPLIASGGNVWTIAVHGSFLAVGGYLNGYALLFDVSAAPPVQIGSRYIGAFATHLAFSPGGTKLYVALDTRIDALDENETVVGPGNLFVLRVSTLAVKSVLDAGFFPLHSAALFNQYLYITSIGAELWSIDTATDTFASPGPLIIPGSMSGIAASGNVFVGNQSTGEIQIVRTGRTPAQDAVDGKVTLPPDSAPFGLAVVPKIKGKPL